ncbi:PQQ-binding-like beta-propeller repeat protein [Streptomyces sp. NPDC001663]|uniref:protein kinase domain-containing protein n=1 Tax=Streptomyces sp. NPDC001663 TaxID=3364597 RepID=UPI0036CA45F6
MEALRANDPRWIGPYEVLGRLGAGGMGEVYLAEGRGGPRLAVKVVRAEHAEDRTFRARFRQEVRAAQTIGGTGTYTARVVDADTEAERPWMATEFVEGPNLRDAVLDHGALPEQAVRLLAGALGEALTAIHAKGMVHRDLKPSNILLSPDGPRVIDFGIVRALEATALTNTGAVVGSVGYVSPEQIRNGAEVGPPSDVFSLGAVLAHAAAGREPFGEGQDSVILLRILTRDFDLSGVPDGLRELVEACLREQPADRPTPARVVEAAGHTAESLREGLRPGWYATRAATTPDPVPEADRWLPERDSGERESRVEYVAPMTVTDATARPALTGEGENQVDDVAPPGTTDAAAGGRENLDAAAGGRGNPGGADPMTASPDAEIRAEAAGGRLSRADGVAPPGTTDAAAGGPENPRERVARMDAPDVPVGSAAVGGRVSRADGVAPMTVMDVTDSAAAGVGRPSRRGLLRVLVGGGVVAAGAGTGGWLWLRDRDGGDRAEGSGVSPEVSVSTSRSATGTLPPGVSWTYGVGGLGGRAGGRHGACVALSPAGDILYVGGADGALHAVSPAGKKLWATDLGGPVMPPLATADGAYCLLENEGEGASKLCAVGPDGRIRWTKKIAGPVGSQFPVAAGDLVLVASGTADAGGVRAYTAAGDVAWYQQTVFGPTSEPTVAGGVAYVGTFGDVVNALDVKDGNLRWSAPTGGDTGRPTLVGRRLLVGSSGDYPLHGINLSGTTVWSTGNDEAGGGRYFTSVRLGDLAVTTDQGRLAALDPSDGKTRWTFDGSGDGSDHSDPTVVGNTVYVCLGGALYAVDRNGKQRRKLSFGDPEPDGGVHSPVLHGTRAYVATAEGVAALDIGA